MYDEEFERALEESDGDMEYAAFDENHHFQVPEDAIGRPYDKQLLMWVKRFNLPCTRLNRATQKCSPVSLVMLVGPIRTV